MGTCQVEAMQVSRGHHLGVCIEEMCPHYHVK